MKSGLSLVTQYSVHIGSGCVDVSKDTFRQTERSNSDLRSHDCDTFNCHGTTV